jgi:DUF1680 family protein
VAPGTVTIERPFTAGDEITLDLPMHPRWTAPDPRIDAVRGCVAAERGPIVYCAESVDLPDASDVGVLTVDPTVSPSDVDGDVVVTARIVQPEDSSWPYVGAPRSDMLNDPVDVALHPYHDWGNRGPSTMRVWLPAAARREQSLRSERASASGRAANSGLRGRGTQ